MINSTEKTLNILADVGGFSLIHFYIMPNYIKNRLKIIGTKEQVSEVLGLISATNEDGTLKVMDFNKVIPSPKDDAYNDIPSQEAVKHLPNWWYTWNLKNWGCKWNASESYKKADTIYFQTAWSAPQYVIEKLSNLFPTLKMEFTYANEDTSSNTGKGVILNGDWIELTQPESGTIEGYELYFELNPEDKENFVLVDGNYEYIEEED